DEIGIEQFTNLLLESPQLTRLRLMVGVVRPEDLTAAFNRTNQTPKPISLPSLITLFVSHYTAPDTLSFTLCLINAPNLKHLRLADLDSDAEGSALDFSSTFEFLGTGTLSSFERLETLELRRVSCRSGAAWSLLCAKLPHGLDMILSYISDGPIEPDGDGDVYEGYLSTLVRPIPGVTTEERNVFCRNLRSLSMSGCSLRTVIDFARRRLEAGHGIAQIIYGGSIKPPDSAAEELENMGVECVWFSDPDSEAEEDPEGDENGF
ncbi:hypothetical protein FRC01_009636, partial [Tulasnella sp. 417]